jgi:hypothetical protein
LSDSDDGDFGDAAQALPFGMTLGEPGNSVDAAMSLLDPPVSGVRLAGARPCLLQGGVGEGQRDVVAQARLVALQRGHVVGLFLHDLGRDRFLRSHRVDRAAAMLTNE